MKKAFTMLELVMIIVVIGILAAVMLPRLSNKPLHQATMRLLSDLRYTQHLALIDDKLDTTDTSWFKKRWQIHFDGDKYSIVSDNNATYAKDPLNSSKELRDIDMNAKYGVTISPCDSDISFDHLGRPFTGALNAKTSPYEGLLTSNCNITISAGSETKVITITPETGYVYIH